MTRFALDQRHFLSLLWYMISVVDGPLYVLNCQHGTETCWPIQDMQLAEGKELEDWPIFRYVDILHSRAFNHLFHICTAADAKIRANVAALGTT